MKVFIRFLGLSLMGLCTIFLVISLVAANIAQDELEVISGLAMSNAQLLMSEIIEDRMSGLNTARYLFNDDISYFENYRESFDLLTGGSDKYRVELVSADYSKGLLAVRVSRRIIRKEISKELLNIVEVSENEIG